MKPPYNARMMELYEKLKAEYGKATKRVRIHRPTLYDCARAIGVEGGPAASMDNAERLVVDLVHHGLVEFVSNGAEFVPKFRL